MQWNLSNTATVGTKEGGCIRKVAALSSTQQPLEEMAFQPVYRGCTSDLPNR